MTTKKVSLFNELFVKPCKKAKLDFVYEYIKKPNWSAFYCVYTTPEQHDQIITIAGHYNVETKSPPTPYITVYSNEQTYHKYHGKQAWLFYIPENKRYYLLCKNTVESMKFHLKGAYNNHGTIEWQKMSTKSNYNYFNENYNFLDYNKNIHDKMIIDQLTKDLKSIPPMYYSQYFNCIKSPEFNGA